MMENGYYNITNYISLETLDKVLVNRYGQMEQNMLGNGLIIKLTVMVHFFISMEIYVSYLYLFN